MKKEITLGQLLSVAVTILIAIATGWITLNNKVAKSEERDRNLEIKQTELEIRNERKFDRIDNKLDAIQTGISDIKEKKADRR